jgi:ribosome assembly protein 1
MHEWLPLAEAALSMASKHLPAPVAAAPLRAPHLTASTSALPEHALERLQPSVRRQLTHTLQCIESSSAEPDSPVITFVSKMVAVPAVALPLAPGERPPVDPRKEVFLGFGRVFSGVLRVGQRVHVLSPVYSPLNPQQHRYVGIVPSHQMVFYGSSLLYWSIEVL